MPGLLWLLVALIVIVVVAYVAHYLIRSFLPTEIQQPVLILVGLLLLVFLLYTTLGHFQIDWGPPSRVR
jgi:Na+/proline symporter